jgi:indole-3-glycerol phosphate synthase
LITYLDRIVDAHRQRAAADQRSTEALIDEIAALDPVRDFAAALTGPGLAVIAEIKRRSPSKGALALDLHPATLAERYQDGGAACMSVLTDEDFFGGSRDDLVAARAAVSLPVLRKDFTVSANDVCDARLMGADCVLLIAAALDDGELRGLHQLARQVGIHALVEIHDEAELERALDVGALLVGVNQRDLVTFAVDTERAVRMAPLMPTGVVRVAESGVDSPALALRLHESGYDAILVGEYLVRSGDVANTVRALRGHSTVS